MKAHEKRVPTLCIEIDISERDDLMLGLDSLCENAALVHVSEAHMIAINELRAVLRRWEV